MTDQPRTIAEMFAATVELHIDDLALGMINKGKLSWEPWGGGVDGVWGQVNEEAMWSSHDASEDGIAAVMDRANASPNRRLEPRLSLIYDLAAQVLLAGRIASKTGHENFDEQDLHRVLESPVSPDDIVRFSDQIPTACASLVPTSGTSGQSRTVALSHQNLVSNTIAVAETIAGSLDDDPRDEVRLSFLPFSHLYARVCDLYCWIYRGSKLVLAESRETIFRDCQLAKPTAINGVPYFFQKVIDLADREKTSIKKLLGGQIRRCYCGGAFLSPAVEQRFWDEGVPLLNGYGLSEASPVVTVSTIKDFKLGTVGKALPGVDVRIADDGEVLVRGPNVMMGYWGSHGIDEGATAEVIRDGWLHTGDLGSLDEEGFLTIHGRKKETLVLSTGKNVLPSRIEALLSASPWIEQCAVVGDHQKHLAAVIVPNPQRVRAEVRKQRLWVWSKKSALRHAAIRAIFEQEIAERLARLPSHEQIHKFTLLPRGFSQKRGEMTEKLSLRRSVIEQSLASEIRSLYQ